MKNKMFTIVLPRSAFDGAPEDAPTTIDSVSGLSQGLDDLTQPGAEDTNNDPEPVSTQGQNDPAATATDPNQVVQTQQQSKTDYAFATMRTQIKAQNTLLEKIAKASGIEYSDVNDLTAKLSDDALGKMAQKSNIPKEYLERIEALEQNNTLLQQDRCKENAHAGFRELQQQYALTQEQLQAFAAELDEAELNPFEQEINIVEQYKVMHFDDIVQAKINKAVADALRKDGMSGATGSVIAAGQGHEDNNGENKVSTVAGLTAMLNAIK